MTAVADVLYQNYEEGLVYYVRIMKRITDYIRTMRKDKCTAIEW